MPKPRSASTTRPASAAASACAAGRATQWRCSGARSFPATSATWCWVSRVTAAAPSARPVRVHDDGWKITGCPHRGGQVALDGKGAAYAAWYTEGKKGVPTMLLAVCAGWPPLRGARANQPVLRDYSRPGPARGEPRWGAWWSGRTRPPCAAASSCARARTVGARWDRCRCCRGRSRRICPDVAVLPDGDFVVAWHEEQFPSLKTIVQRVKVAK